MQNTQYCSVKDNNGCCVCLNNTVYSACVLNTSGWQILNINKIKRGNIVNRVFF